MDAGAEEQAARAHHMAQQRRRVTLLLVAVGFIFALNALDQDASPEREEAAERVDPVSAPRGGGAWAARAPCGGDGAVRPCQAGGSRGPPCVPGGVYTRARRG
jgi:hypothetical protein